MPNLLNRYSELLNRIGIKNLPALPDEMKERLKNTTRLAEKVRVLEDIVASLERQGLVK